MLVLFAGCRPTLESPGDPSARAPRRYAKLLESVVTDDGYVDYDRLADDRAALDDYVAWLGRVGPDLSQNPGSGRMQAFWLNAYNALVLFSVLEHGRPDSVMDVAGPAPGAGFFLLHDFQVGDDQVSLWDIEHERIRHRFLDERMHAVMNCAGRSCPPLRPKLVQGTRVGKQLDDYMQAWVNDPERGVRIEDGRIVANPIFDWFAEDFHRWTGQVTLCEYLLDYAEEPLATALSAEDCQIVFYEYDWALNHQAIDG